MSYLDVPRLHFAGSFIAKPSTVNNTPTNFDPATPSSQAGLVLAWNPYGNHDWQFLNCDVQTAVTSDGTVWNSTNPEPIVGATVNSTDKPVTAKLVDLDTEQQMVSQIWGLQIKVAVANSTSDYFVGTFRPISFDDIWFRVPNGQQDWMFGAYYQSVLDQVSWGPQITSPFLQELQQASPDHLSIKFIVDGYQDLYYLKNFNQGRMVGSIGPYHKDEPPNFLRGRQLRPIGFKAANGFSGTPLYYGYAQVDEARQKVVVDLGNSIPTQAEVSTDPPTQSPTGPPVDVGTLSVAIIPQNGGDPVMLGDYEYSLAAYLATAGVQEYSVTTDQLTTLTSTPLGVVQTAAPKGSTKPALGTVLQESPTGAYINAIQPVFRMNPGECATAEVMALQFGKAVGGQEISIKFHNGPLEGQAAPGIPVGTPASALTFPKSVTTGADGRASFEMQASDPNNPRVFIDGQVYGVGYSWAEDNQPGFPSDPNTFLSVLVFDTYAEDATWPNIQPFMMQYATLYPFMDTIFMLSDPEVYQQNIAAFKGVLSSPITDPRYMPVTRDMSRDKRALLLAWLDAGAPL
ncbi:MAG TPA: hypothetical protein VMS31_02870 [Pyrinomonadaceae bacterium]|nr:hypothetical protein [Pyrinomonadaceae bacterium]